MERYIIYCTEAQTEKAIKLGAPCCNPSDVEGRCPTAEQMIGWLEEHGFAVEVLIERHSYHIHVWMKIGKGWVSLYEHYHNGTRREATISALDKALDYLTNKKERAMTREEIKNKAVDCCITEDEVRGFCRGAWWMQEQLTKWISVEDRLPKNNDSVLVYGHCKEDEPDYIDYIVMATYYDGVFDSIDATANSSIMVVHCWMPLPPKPNV